MQADLKTFSAHGVYGMSVITAVTSQNTLGVKHVHSIPADVVSKQLEVILDDIPPAAIKLGMLDNANTVLIVAELLKQHTSLPIVIDPVFVSSSGRVLLSSRGIGELIKCLFPLASLITPNLNEVQVLCQALNLNCPSIKTEAELRQAGAALQRQLKLEFGRSPALLCKGGHLQGDAADLLLIDQQGHWLRSERIVNPNIHGTGCTLSAAIAANLASGSSLLSAVENAKKYLHGAIKRGLDLGQGVGPLAH